MDTWRQQRFQDVNEALDLTVQRIEKLVRRINRSSINTKPMNNNHNQLCRWTNEVARLQDMEDQLLDFRDKLFFYSNVEYVEARRKWDRNIAKQVAKARSFGQLPSVPSGNQQHRAPPQRRATFG